MNLLPEDERQRMLKCERGMRTESFHPQPDAQAGKSALPPPRRPALPCLADNIKCGNSLIGPDFFADQTPGRYDQNQRRRINAFDWEAEFPTVLATGGFDAVIGNRDFLVCCACSAGPAFEGGSVTCGMRATSGAIDSVRIFHRDMAVSATTVDGSPPVGLCGLLMMIMRVRGETSARSSSTVR